MFAFEQNFNGFSRYLDVLWQNGKVVLYVSSFSSLLLPSNEKEKEKEK